MRQGNQARFRTRISQFRTIDQEEQLTPAQRRAELQVLRDWIFNNPLTRARRTQLRANLFDPRGVAIVRLAQGHPTRSLEEIGISLARGDPHARAVLTSAISNIREVVRDPTSNLRFPVTIQVILRHTDSTTGTRRYFHTNPLQFNGQTLNREIFEEIERLARPRGAGRDHYDDVTDMGEFEVMRIFVAQQVQAVGALPRSRMPPPPPPRPGLGPSSAGGAHMALSLRPLLANGFISSAPMPYPFAAWSVARLQTPSVSCIFEAALLARAKISGQTICQEYYQHEGKWTSQVLQEYFHRIPMQVRVIAEMGMVRETVAMLSRLWAVPIDVIDGHDIERELIRLRVEFEDTVKNQVYVLYFREHVYPYDWVGLQKLQQQVLQKKQRLLKVGSAFYLRSQLLMLKTMRHEGNPGFESQRMRNVLLLTNAERDALCVSRTRRFDDKALCGLDIETAIDNDDPDMLGNARPVLLSISGSLQKLCIKWDEENNKAIETLTTEHNVNLSFMGRDCIKQFVLFLRDGGYTESYRCRLEQVHESKTKRIRPRNVFFAHNGAKFDYRFLHEMLHIFIGDMEYVGDIRGPKFFCGHGIAFYDTSLVLDGSLKAIALQFFPNDPTRQKLDNDDVVDLSMAQADWFAENPCDVRTCRWREYCERDAYVVKEIARVFFRTLYTTSFGENCFVQKAFYYSVASLAWEVWSRCFLESDIAVNSDFLHAERASYRGGLTVCFKTELEYGVSIDINSSYPAAMLNFMPARHIDPGEFRQDLQPHYLYLAAFQYPEGTQFPDIAIRIEGSIVQPRAIKKAQYIWGVELLQAVRHGATVSIEEVIGYEALATHRTFIRDLYEKRKEAKRLKNAVLETLFKKIMNSSYGKHGQKTYPKIFIGGYQGMRDRIQEALTLERTQAIHTLQVPMTASDVFQVAIDHADAEVCQKGATVRFASYITAIARVNLMNAIHAAVNAFGVQSICYVDTDSIFLDLSATLRTPAIERAQQSLQEKFGITLNAPDENLDADAWKALTVIEESFKSTCERLDDLRVPDIGNVGVPRILKPLISDTELGAYKIEKYIFAGHFLGQKQYCISYFSPGSTLQHSTSVRMKGVAGMKRTPEAFADFYNAYKAGERHAHQPVTQVQFASMVTGVNISETCKIIQPTLTKRIFTAPGAPSAPFEDEIEFCNSYAANVANREEVKQELRAMPESLIRLSIDRLKEDPAYQKRSRGTSYIYRIQAQGARALLNITTDYIKKGEDADCLENCVRSRNIRIASCTRDFSEFNYAIGHFLSDMCKRDDREGLHDQSGWMFRITLLYYRVRVAVRQYQKLRKKTCQCDNWTCDDVCVLFTITLLFSDIIQVLGLSRESSAEFLGLAQFIERFVRPATNPETDEYFLSRKGWRKVARRVASFMNLPALRGDYASLWDLTKPYLVGILEESISLEDGLQQNLPVEWSAPGKSAPQIDKSTLFTELLQEITQTRQEGIFEQLAGITNAVDRTDHARFSERLRLAYAERQHQPGSYYAFYPAIGRIMQERFPRVLEVHWDLVMVMAVFSSLTQQDLGTLWNEGIRQGGPQKKAQDWSALRCLQIIFRHPKIMVNIMKLTERSRRSVGQQAIQTKAKKIPAAVCDSLMTFKRIALDARPENTEARRSDFFCEYLHDTCKLFKKRKHFRMFSPADLLQAGRELLEQNVARTDILLELRQNTMGLLGKRRFRTDDDEEEEEEDDDDDDDVVELGTTFAADFEDELDDYLRSCAEDTQFKRQRTE